MAHKVALINMKGGVGKSTIAVNLAWHMALGWDLSVLVIDLDPQFNCSQYLIGHRGIETLISEDRPTVWDIFERLTKAPRQQGASTEVEETLIPILNAPNIPCSIHLIPSSLNLARTLRHPTGKEQMLKRAVKEIEDRFDLVIIDCAPTDSILTTAAYFAADHLLIPVRPDFLSSIGLPLIERSLDEHEKVYDDRKPTILGIVFNAIENYPPGETTSKQEVVRIARENNWDIFDEEIRNSKSYRSSARTGLPLFRTPYTHRVVKRNFHAFAIEFARRIGL